MNDCKSSPNKKLTLSRETVKNLNVRTDVRAGIPKGSMPHSVVGGCTLPPTVTCTNASCAGFG
jgi:hypothetical protein